MLKKDVAINIKRRKRSNSAQLVAEDIFRYFSLGGGKEVCHFRKEGLLEKRA